jgi:hypothetical protein
MVPGLGLISPDAPTDREQLLRTGGVAVEESNEAFRVPLLRDAELLNERAGPDCQYILLGSIASPKYTEPLMGVFGERLLFPADFVGRGDMSRGGLMRRCVGDREELAYLKLSGATRSGKAKSPDSNPYRARIHALARSFFVQVLGRHHRPPGPVWCGLRQRRGRAHSQSR